MVAYDRKATELSYSIYDASRIGAFGDQVAHHDEAVAAPERSDGEQVVQFVRASMHVTDDEGSSRGHPMRAIPEMSRSITESKSCLFAGALRYAAESS